MDGAANSTVGERLTKEVLAKAIVVATAGESLGGRWQWESKIWGEVTHCFFSPAVAVSVLWVNAGFRCSRHLHKRRRNFFYVVRGEIEVWEWASEGDVKQNPNMPVYIHRIGDEVSGRKWNSVSVNSKRPHMFRVLESGIVVEIYTPAASGGAVDVDDIVRFDCGERFDGVA